jgi:RNA polymerase sigma-70 factor (ECF subfamily)
VREPAAWLTRVTTRLCLDRLRSAPARREVYKGPWLPEPILTDTPNPLVALERTESLSLAFLFLLERLGSAERAAFVLREVFELPYSDIAGHLERKPAACRQLVRRARAKLDEEPGGRRTAEASGADPEGLLRSFVAAAEEGNLGPLLAALDPEATLYSDGGGKVLAALHPIHGADKILRFFAGIRAKAPADLRFEPREINGEPGLLVWGGGELLQIMALEVAEGRVRRLFVVRNPDKLGRMRDAPVTRWP